MNVSLVQYKDGNEVSFLVPIVVAAAPGAVLRTIVRPNLSLTTGHKNEYHSQFKMSSAQEDRVYGERSIQGTCHP